jgi:hypothetical protein
MITDHVDDDDRFTKIWVENLRERDHLENLRERDHLENLRLDRKTNIQITV